MATTRIMSLHINQGKTAAQCFQERMDYIMNPDKTDGGISKIQSADQQVGNVRKVR